MLNTTYQILKCLRFDAQCNQAILEFGFELSIETFPTILELDEPFASEVVCPLVGLFFHPVCVGFCCLTVASKLDPERFLSY